MKLEACLYRGAGRGREDSLYLTTACPEYRSEGIENLPRIELVIKSDVERTEKKGPNRSAAVAYLNEDCKLYDHCCCCGQGNLRERSGHPS